MFYVLIMASGTFTTTCYETATNFVEAYSHHHIVWQTYESYEHYIAHRYETAFLGEKEANGGTQ